MKVVAVVPRAYYSVTPSGGAEMMLHLMLRHLVQHEWEVTAVVADGLPGTVDVQGVKVVTPKDKAEFHEVFQGHDVAITHLGGTPRARGMSTLYNIPLVQLIHNTSEYSVGFLGDGCDFAIYNSQWVHDFHEAQKGSEIIKVWQYPKTSYVKRRTSHEWPSIVLRPPVPEWVPGWGGGVDGYITLINLVPNKGPDVFYSVAAANPHLQFMGVIGGYQPEDQDIRVLPNVKILEHTSDINTIYDQTSILMVPSRYESYGLVAVEAMGRGIPVVAAPTPGLKECIGLGGTYCDRDNLPSWSGALATIRDNYDFESKLSRNRYETLFTKSSSELFEFQYAMRRVVHQWESSVSLT